MYPNLFIYLIFITCVASANFNKTIRLYLDTIRREQTKSESYIGPKDASFYKPTSDDCTDYGKKFDYIIVGGGSAGAVIASRLSEDPTKSVLLLEAGGSESVFGNIPSMTFFLHAQEYNWNFNSTPQTSSCLGMINRECPYPRGKGLGGTSLINGLIYSRGNREDYDNWRDMGNVGWGYNDVLPYFKKSENFLINGDYGYHQQGGYLNVEYHKPNSPQLDAFIEANVRLGRPIVDYNGQHQLGVSKTQFNYLMGTRQSSAKSFLFPILHRRNLVVLPYSYVIKVLVKQRRFNKAYGVIFTHNKKLYKAKSKKEVIISAGAIGSPHLLMLSGIGPKDHLLSLGIPVIQNLPVGNHFEDHTAYQALYFSTNYTEPAKSMATYIEEYLHGYGPFSIVANLQGLGFYKSKRNRNYYSANPDIELIMQPSNNSDAFGQRTFHYDDVAYQTIWNKIDPQRSFSILSILLHPKSKGTIRLKSSNPYDYPLIDTQYLSDKDGEDIETLYEAVQLALEIANTEPFKKMNTSLIDIALPQCIQKHRYLSKEYWYCQLRHLSFHIYHASGTCRMGTDPLTSVVNSELKVHGIQNLRVVDASIFPSIIAGHTHAPTVMVAEKAADLIKLDAWWHA